jgi:hypothetical protein
VGFLAAEWLPVEARAALTASLLPLLRGERDGWPEEARQ